MQDVAFTECCNRRVETHVTVLLNWSCSIYIESVGGDNLQGGCSSETERGSLWVQFTLASTFLEAAIAIK